MMGQFLAFANRKKEEEMKKQKTKKMLALEESMPTRDRVQLQGPEVSHASLRNQPPNPIPGTQWQCRYQEEEGFLDAAKGIVDNVIKGRVGSMEAT